MPYQLRIAALRLHHVGKPRQSAPVLQLLFHQGTGRLHVRADVRQHKHPASQGIADLRDIRRPLSAQNVNGLLHLQNIADRIAKRLVHV